jgi:hypothetical protein
LRISKEKAQQEAIKVGIGRFPIGRRIEPIVENEVKILSAGPILAHKLHEAYFTINEFKIHGQSAHVGQTTFENFWSNIETTVSSKDFPQRMDEHRQHLWKVWLVQANSVTTDKTYNKHVNRYEYLNLWRRICATGGWFWQDFPPELRILYQCFDLGTKENLESDAISLCLELKAFWKAHSLFLSADRRYARNGQEFLWELGNLQNSERFKRIGAHGYRPTDDELALAIEAKENDDQIDTPHQNSANDTNPSRALWSNDDETALAVNQTVTIDQQTEEPIAGLMVKPAPTVWVNNPFDKPFEKITNLEEAKQLLQRYTRDSQANNVTNEYFVCHHIRPEAWEQLRYKFTLDMGVLGENIWKRWNNDQLRRTEVGTWTADLEQLVQHYENTKDRKSSDNQKFFHLCRRVDFRLSNYENGKFAMENFRNRIVKA